MKLTRRQINLIRIIQQNPHSSLKEISELLEISLQTVKADLQNMQDIMKDYNVGIEFLPGNALRIWGEENINYMLNAFQTMQEFSLEKQIMLYLLCRDGFVVLQDIADGLYISKSLVEKVMSVMLEKYPDELSSMRRHGVRNIATQVERRSRFAKLLRPYITGIDFEAELEKFHDNHFPLLDYLEAKEIERAAAAIDYVRQLEEISFTDEAVNQLFLHLVYAQLSYRLFSNVTVGFLVEDMLEGMPQVVDYRGAVDKICRMTALPEAEKSYFAYLFLMLRKQKIDNRGKFVDVMHNVLEKVFVRIKQRLTVDLSDDKELANGLAVHIYSTVVRRDKLGREMGDATGITDVRNQYPLGFEMAAIAAEVIAETFSYHVPPGEMMYLALHFQAGIERMKSTGRKVRTLVVCHYGLAAASLIAVRVEQMFPAVEIVDSISVQYFLQMKEIDAELVLSTENIKRPDVSVIYVTPMLADGELKQIGRFVEAKCTESMLAMFLQNAKILTLNDKESKEAVLEKAARFLEKDGCVTQDFLTSLQAREKVSTTDIGDIAIPHGDPDYVQRTQMLIVRMKKPVPWGQSAVKIVFMFAISRQQFEKNLQMFSSFYKALARVNTRAELRKIQDQNDEAFQKSVTYLLSKQ